MQYPSHFHPYIKWKKAGIVGFKRNTLSDCGILNIDLQKQTYKIDLLIKGKKEIKLAYNSVNEMIDAGWAVDWTNL